MRIHSTSRAALLTRILPWIALSIALKTACGGDTQKGSALPSDGGGSDNGGSQGEPAPAGAAGVREGVVPPCSVWDGLQICDAQSTVAVPSPSVSMLLVVDRSSSMRATVPGQDRSKWEILREALLLLLDECAERIQFGLELFPGAASTDPLPDSCGETMAQCCEMPEGNEMTVDINHGTQDVSRIIDALGVETPSGASPGADALGRAFDYFVEAGETLGPGRFVLLGTDGGLNCNDALSCAGTTCTLDLDPSEGCSSGGASCCGDMPTGCLDDQATLEQIERLAGLGVQTIVVGIPDNDAYARTLEELAQAGGVPTPDAVNGYFDLSPGSTSTTTLAALCAPVSTSTPPSCEFPLELEVTSVDLDDVRVAIDCNVVPHGDPDGEGDRWYYNNADSPTAVIIGGAVCDTLLAEDAWTVDIILPCAGPD